MSVNKKSVEEKIQELEDLLTWFESNEVTVESALDKYERAGQIASELENELNKAKNKVEVIKKKFA
ncbi:exodeoxyribonuclease VII small subunit [Candidatus Nomurabacteria bacterium]|nr:exodeoxyribonuclease VII small subunit [Candidatus Nomurabacteria bacterium]